MKTISNNIWKNISDTEYIAGLKHNDSHITEAFFYGLCNYTLNDIRLSLMQNCVDYDELVNELFLYLSDKDWHKLDTFAGINGCKLRSWIIRITWRYFMNRREHLIGVNTLNTDDVQISETNKDINLDISLDVEATFSHMSNERYVQVLKWMLIEGYDAKEVAARLKTNITNVYNIKHRAIIQFTEVYNVSE